MRAGTDPLRWAWSTNYRRERLVHRAYGARPEPAVLAEFVMRLIRPARTIRLHPA